MKNEFERLNIIVAEINMHRQKGSITAGEMSFVESKIPEVVRLTPSGTFILIATLPSETPEIMPIPPDEPRPAISTEIRREDPNDESAFEAEITPDGPDDRSNVAHKTIPSNRSLNGRHLEIIPREQNLLAAIRRGASQNEILSGIYGHLPLQRAISQMLNDSQHIRDLLQINGCNLLMHSGPEGYRFEEVINAPKPGSALSNPSFASKRPEPKEAPATTRTAPPASPGPRPPDSGELNESNLLPTEVIAYNAIRNSFPESPLGAGKWLSAMNTEREKAGARPLGIYDLEGLISNIKEATGISIIKVTHHNKDFYYRERRRNRKP